MKTFADFTALVKLCIQAAEQRYGIDLGQPAIFYDLKGKTAAQAIYKAGSYSLRFNTEAIRKEWDDMVKSTIPHEVAHLVQHRISGKFSHDAEWRSIDRALGGTGDRCHRYELTPAKRKSVFRYKYQLPSGTVVAIGPKHHKIVQMYSSWSPITVKNTGEMITKRDFKEAVKIR